MVPIAVIYMGAAGSGKGKNSERLASRRGYARLEMGEYLRHLKATSTDPYIKEQLEPIGHGRRVNDAFIIKQSIEWIRNTTGSIVLDGVIRSKPQFDAVVAVLKERGYDIKAVWFTTPPAECFKRLTSGKRGREDDHRTSIIRRIQTYVSEIRHLKQFFIDARILIISVDNTKLSEEETYQAVMNWLHPEVASNNSGGFEGLTVATR